jgi:hypothetical protein
MGGEGGDMVMRKMWGSICEGMWSGNPRIPTEGISCIEMGDPSDGTRDSPCSYLITSVHAMGKTIFSCIEPKNVY